MNLIIVLLTLMVAFQSFAQKSPEEYGINGDLKKTIESITVVPLNKNGTDEDRLSIVFMVADKEAKQHDIASRAMAQILSTEPFSRYATFFNFYLIKIKESKKSAFWGADTATTESKHCKRDTKISSVCLDDVLDLYTKVTPYGDFPFLLYDNSSISQSNHFLSITGLEPQRVSFFLGYMLANYDRRSDLIKVPHKDKIKYAWLKPDNNTKMQNTKLDFGSKYISKLVDKLYDYTNLIDDSTPAGEYDLRGLDYIYIYPKALPHTVDKNGKSVPTASFEWKLNGQKIEKFPASGHIGLREFDLIAGENTISYTIKDLYDKVTDDNVKEKMKSTVTWKVNVHKVPQKGISFSEGHYGTWYSPGATIIIDGKNDGNEHKIEALYSVGSSWDKFVGVVSDESTAIGQIYSYKDGEFFGNGSPNKKVYAPEAKIEFFDCRHGRLYYKIPNENPKTKKDQPFFHHLYPIKRISEIHRDEKGFPLCGDSAVRGYQSQEILNMRPYHTGTWTYSGEDQGQFYLEYHDSVMERDKMSFLWFTYTYYGPDSPSNGAPVMVAGSTEIQKGQNPNVMKINSNILGNYNHQIDQNKLSSNDPTIQIQFTSKCRAKAIVNAPNKIQSAYHKVVNQRTLELKKNDCKDGEIEFKESSN